MGEILDSLSEDQRAVVVMYYYEQMTVREIADELGYDSETELYLDEATARSVAELFRKDSKFSEVSVSEPVEREVLVKKKKRSRSR